MMRIVGILIITAALASCVRNKNGQNTQTSTPESSNVFEVSEVIHGNTYTYMKVKEDMTERWVATGKTEASAGDVLYYGEALEMPDFHSKELDRTFDKIYFIDRVSEQPIEHAHSGQKPMGQMGREHSGAVESEQNRSISLDKSGDEVTIADIYANPKDFEEKEFEIRGVVTKVNKEIMGKNWVHLQDGTSNDDSFDLTVTTQALPEVNDEVTFKGSLTLKKDFGAGYYYDVIMQDAALVSKNEATTTQL
ncbi:MAG: hypothetical protein ACOCWD_03120 [Tangfeifania sp.]